MFFGPLRIFFRKAVPGIPGLDKTSVNGIFCFQACLYCIFIILKCSYIKSLPLKSYGGTVLSIIHMVDSTKTAGIVTAVFSFFQHFHAGSINHMKLPRKFFPDFLARQPQLL